jgi:hypothetical protein
MIQRFGDGFLVRPFCEMAAFGIRSRTIIESRAMRKTTR